MTQQINLYLALHHDQEGWPSAVQLVQVAAGAIAVMTLWCVVSGFMVAGKEGELTALEVTRNALEQSVQEVREKYGIRDKDAALAARLAELKHEQESKTVLLSGLSARNQGTKSGFARHIQGLARQRVHGLWLTRINVLEGGHEMILQGRSMRPEYVPQFLQLLGNELAFQGQEFSEFVMKRADEETDDILFTLSSTPEDPKKRGRGR